MNCSAATNHHTSFLHPASRTTEPPPSIHIALAGKELGWNMTSRPKGSILGYERLKDDVAFPMQELKSIRISRPRTFEAERVLGSWTIEITKERPLTVHDVLEGLYKGVNQDYQLRDSLSPQDRSAIECAAKFRRSTLSRAMSESYNYSDQYSYKVVDCFYGMWTFAGLSYLEDGSWGLNISIDLSKFRNWWVESLRVYGPSERSCNL